MKINLFYFVVLILIVLCSCRKTDSEPVIVYPEPAPNYATEQTDTITATSEVNDESDGLQIGDKAHESNEFIATIDKPNPKAIKIYTPEDLDNVRNDLNASYVLMNDLEMFDWGNWIPIGDSNMPFSGEFDGQGHRIIGLTISDSNLIHIGLFGYCKFDDDGLGIKNVGLVQRSLNNYAK